MRSLVLGVLTVAGLAAGGTSASAEPYTTRIEPRPYYGATVTVEHGVRVIRPLPPHDRIIINPGYTTPRQINVGGKPASPR